MLTDKLLSPGPREEGQGPYQGEGRGAGWEPGGLPEQGDEPLEEEDEDQGHEYVAKVHCAELSNNITITLQLMAVSLINSGLLRLGPSRAQSGFTLLHSVSVGCGDLPAGF